MKATAFKDTVTTEIKGSFKLAVSGSISLCGKAPVFPGCILILLEHSPQAVPAARKNMIQDPDGKG